METLRAAAVATVLSSAALFGAACGGSTAQDVLAQSQSAGTSGGTSSGAPLPKPDVPCGAMETEKNDGEGEANELVGSICGSIDPPEDEDMLVFRLKETTTRMRIDFKGSVELRVKLRDQSYDFKDGSFPSVPVDTKAQYSVRVRSAAKGATTTWQVTIVEE